MKLWQLVVPFALQAASLINTFLIYKYAKELNEFYKCTSEGVCVYGVFTNHMTYLMKSIATTALVSGAYQCLLIIYYFAKALSYKFLNFLKTKMGRRFTTALFLAHVNLQFFIIGGLLHDDIVANVNKVGASQGGLRPLHPGAPPARVLATDAPHRKLRVEKLCKRSRGWPWGRVWLRY